MPKGVYIKTEEHKKKLSDANKGKRPQNPFPLGIIPRTVFRKGNIPHNKGTESPIKLKKMEKFRAGLSILCKRHGEHTKWRMHTDNNVQCLHCAAHWQRERKKKNPLKTLWRDAKTHAKTRKWDFLITIENIQQVYEKQNGLCALTGVKFSESCMPSLDRKDSNKGYTLENIQLLQIKINRMKSNIDEEEFIKTCKEVWDYSKENSR